MSKPKTKITPKTPEQLEAENAALRAQLAAKGGDTVARARPRHLDVEHDTDAADAAIGSFVTVTTARGPRAALVVGRRTDAAGVVRTEVRVFAHAYADGGVRDLAVELPTEG